MPAFQIQVRGLLDGATPLIIPSPIPAPIEGGVIKIDAGVGIDVGTIDVGALARTPIPLWLRAYHVEPSSDVALLRTTAVNPGSQQPRFITPDIAPQGVQMRPFQLARQVILAAGDILSILTDGEGAPVEGPHFIYLDLVPLINDEQSTLVEELAAYADFAMRSQGAIYESVQAVAASSEDQIGVVSVPQGRNIAGPVAQAFEVHVAIGDAPAAGESMAINVRADIGGLSTVVASINVDDTFAANSTTIIPITLGLNAIEEGSVIRVSRVYTAGGGPTPMTDTSVRVFVVPQQLNQQGEP